MKRFKMKLIVGMIVSIMIISIICPVFAVYQDIVGDPVLEPVIGMSSGKTYYFYSVANGEDLNGKTFLIAGDYQLQEYLPDLQTDVNHVGTNADYSHNLYGFNRNVSTVKLDKLNTDFSYYPILSNDTISFDEHKYVHATSVLNIDDKACYTKYSYEWTFEKNNDGTYSVYLDDSGEKYYLCNEGNNPSLTIAYDARGKYIIEYRDNGKIALKYAGIEHFGSAMLNAPSPNGSNPLLYGVANLDAYKYIVYQPDYESFNSGSANDVSTLRLYNLQSKGMIVYNYSNCTGLLEDYFDNSPTMDSPIQVLSNSEEELYKIENASSTGTYRVYLDTSIPYLEDLYDKKEADTESFKDPSADSSKIWGVEIKPIAWITPDVEGLVKIIDLDAKLSYDEATDTIVGKDHFGYDLALPSVARLSAIYAVKSENIFFNITYKDLNLNDGSLIAEEVDTESLAVGHVYYSEKEMIDKCISLDIGASLNVIPYNVFNMPIPIHPMNIEEVSQFLDTGSVDYEKMNYINLKKSLTDSYNSSIDDTQVVIEGFMDVNPTTHERISYNSVGGKSLKDVVDHVMDYVTDHSNELDVNDIENVNDYDVVWYGTRQESPGTVVRGVMRDMKNFLVIDASFEDIPEEDIPIDDFKIEILDDNGDVLKTLTLKDDDVEISPDKKEYTWKLNDMTENTYTVKQYNRKSGSYVPSTRASTDVGTNVGDVNEDSENDVITCKISTINNHKDQVKLINKYASKDNNNNNNGGQQGGGSNPTGGGAAPAPAGGPITQAVRNVYNGLLPRTGSASAFILTALGIVLIIVVIRLRNKDNKKSKKEKK